MFSYTLGGSTYLTEVINPHLFWKFFNENLYIYNGEEVFFPEFFKQKETKDGLELIPSKVAPKKRAGILNALIASLALGNKKIISFKWIVLKSPPKENEELYGIYGFKLWKPCPIKSLAFDDTFEFEMDRASAEEMISFQNSEPTTFPGNGTFVQITLPITRLISIVVEI